jgi:hypothetical protein
MMVSDIFKLLVEFLERIAGADLLDLAGATAALVFVNTQQVL